MARRKLARFDYNSNAENVIERGKEFYTSIKGKWREKYFKNENPIVLELACGRGEYSVGLASVFPEKNFIGIDIKGDRIARGSKNAEELGLKNVAFLRTSIQFLEEFFIENEIDEIWIIHPDPQPRDKEEKKRLTHKSFLEIYKKLMKVGGNLHLKTDNYPLFEYSLESLQLADYQVLTQTNDLYNSDLIRNHYAINQQYIETYYERMFREKGFKINYFMARLLRK